jgi:hypothetical protein
MTWKQLKEGIDRKLVEEGISEDTPVWYFDFSGPDNVEGEGMDGVVVWVDRDMGLVVS